MSDKMWQKDGPLAETERKQKNRYRRTLRRVDDRLRNHGVTLPSTEA